MHVSTGQPQQPLMHLVYFHLRRNSTKGNGEKSWNLLLVLLWQIVCSNIQDWFWTSVSEVQPLSRPVLLKNCANTTSVLWSSCYLLWEAETRPKKICNIGFSSSSSSLWLRYFPVVEEVGRELCSKTCSWEIKVIFFFSKDISVKKNKLKKQKKKKQKTSKPTLALFWCLKTS